MAFTFTNYAALPLQSSPFKDMIGKMLSGYAGGVNARYLPREKEADIFHKQIAPLAMLASSPYFSSLHPQQQQQIAGYISQMLSKQGLGKGQVIPGLGGTGGNQMPQNGGMATEEGMQGSAPQSQPTEQGGSLVPRNAGEHFTNQYTQSPYASGTPHRGEGGETIYTPTGSNVQKGIDVLTESKGLKKLFDQYADVAPKVGGSGGVRKDLSIVASNIAKTNLPYTQKISELLGGSKVADQAAKAESYKAQMAPALRALGFSNGEIDDLLKIYPGENEKNIKDRLKNTWPLIERKIKSHQKNLQQGINVSNEEPKSIEGEVAKSMKAKNSKGQFREAPEGSIGLYRNGQLYYIPQNEVDEALASGFSYE